MEFIKNIVLKSKKYRRQFAADIIYLKNNTKKPVVIFSHGFKSFKDWGTFNLIAEYFAERGFIFIKFNFPFNGTTIKTPDVIDDMESFRKNSYMTEIENLKEMIDWVLTQKIIPEDEINKDAIFLLGHSRGAVISLIEAANDTRVKKVAAWAPFKDYEDLLVYYDIDKWEKEGVIYTPEKMNGINLPMDYSFYDSYIKNFDFLNIQKTVSNIKIPVMVTHGTEDEIIPFEDSLKLKEWNVNIKLNILPLTNHFFGSYHPYREKYLPFDTKIAVDEDIEFFLKR